MKNSQPMVEAQMLIRRPVAEVFEAFINPEITKNFWFTKGSGRLEAGKNILWEWEMYGVSAKVVVDEIIQNEKIAVRWHEPSTIIEFLFTALDKDRTYVVIKNYGFAETGDQLIEAVKNNTGGFTTVLDGLKAWLEHNINLNLIADKFPGKLASHK